MCWDAMLYCAWAANGINCANVNQAASGFGVVTNNGLNYARIFAAAPFAGRVVRTAMELMNLPQGAFVGFVNQNDNFRLRHAMIHVGEGFGTGNKNDCIFRAGHAIGWERLDMGAFFFADRDHNGNGGTLMVYQPVTGQTV
jgi:hypothetical protein